MMKKSKLLIPLFSFIIILGVSVFAISAQENGWQKKVGAENKSKLGTEFKEQMEVIMQNVDYEAWQELAGDKPMHEQVTAENFAKFAEAWSLAHEGKMDEAKAIYDELGLQGSMGFGKMRGNGRGFMQSGEGRRFVDTNGDGFCDNLDLPAEIQE